MPSTIGKCKLFKIKHTTLLEGETFLRNKHKIEFKKNAHFLVEKKTPLVNKKNLFRNIAALSTFYKLKSFEKLLLSLCFSNSIPQNRYLLTELLRKKVYLKFQIEKHLNVSTCRKII